MNTYKITFTRENGTQGADRFTAATKKQACKDFNECYRHGTGVIVSVELVRTDAQATKQQERDALAKIRQIVDTLGPESYLATAFEGCFDLAAENIERRECISFNADGWIGFAGWADQGNTNPILRAFIEWCDVLAKEVTP